MRVRKKYREEKKEKTAAKIKRQKVGNTKKFSTDRQAEQSRQIRSMIQTARKVSMHAATEKLFANMQDISQQDGGGGGSPFI